MAAVLFQTIPKSHQVLEIRFAKAIPTGQPVFPIFAFICDEAVHYYRQAGGVYGETGRSLPLPGTTMLSIAWPEHADDPTIPNTYVLVSASNDYVYVNNVESPTQPPMPITPTPLIQLAQLPKFSVAMDWHSSNTMWGLGTASVSAQYWGFWPGTGNVVEVHNIHNDWCTGFQYSPATAVRVFCTCSLDGSSKVYGQSNGVHYTYLHNLVPVYSPPKPPPPCTDLEMYAIAYYAAVTAIGCEDGDIQLFDPLFNIFLGVVNTGSEVIQVTAKREPASSHIIVAAACYDGLYIYNMATKTLIQHIQIMQAGTPVICFCCDWNWDTMQLVTSWGDLNIRLYDTI